MTATYTLHTDLLVSAVGAWKTREEVEAMGYQFGAPVQPGDVAVTWCRNAWRRGIVTKVGRKNVTIELTTKTAIEEARSPRYGWTKPNSTTKAMPFADVAAVAPGGHIEADLPQTAEYGPAGDHPDLSDADHGYDTCDGTSHECDHADPAPEYREPVSAEQAALEAQRERNAFVFGPEVAEPAGTVAGVAGSDVVRALETVWDQIRKNHAELPPVIIITGSALVGPPRWGHFWPARWSEGNGHQKAAVDVRHGELFVAGEALARGATEVVATMLHEAAHALAQTREVKDTSRQGRWHNAKFRELAEELGMRYEAEQAHPAAGYSEMVLTDQTRDRYASVIAELDDAIVAHLALPPGLDATGAGEQFPGSHGRRGTASPGQAGEKSRNNSKITCECEPPRIIRASRTVLELGSIRCGLCDAEFTETE